MTNPTIDDIFNQLDKDRHLAGYRLEERASPFFELFLPEALEKHLGIPINPLIIPEFPYLKEDDTNRSPKVDFFALSLEGDRAFLIELKTDMNSERSKQDEDLEAAAERSMFDILSDIRSIASTPKIRQNRQKYFHLLHDLECLNLIEMPDQLRERVYAEDSRGVYDLIKAIEVKGSRLYPKIIYILPTTPDNEGKKDVINFEELAVVVEGRGEIGKKFARSLRRWAEVDAGSVPPGAKCP